MMLADSIAVVFFVALGIFYFFYFLMANPLTHNNNRAHVYGFLNDDIYVITEPQRLSWNRHVLFYTVKWVTWFLSEMFSSSKTDTCYFTV